MTMARLGLGRLGEDLAARAARDRGYEVVARNARTASGELDLVARDGACWIFAEVRCRRGTPFGRPEDSFTARKRARVLQAAQEYLADCEAGDVAWRVDFVAVELSREGSLLRVEWIEDALAA